MKEFIEEYGMTVVSFTGGVVIFGIIGMMLGEVGWRIVEYNVIHFIGTVS